MLSTAAARRSKGSPPIAAARITGSACFTAMTKPRRLMAETRSKASSVISVGGASPPAMETPTL